MGVMAKFAKPMQILGVLLLGGIVQVLLGVLDLGGHKDFPGKAVIEFARAYYQKDAAMSARICSDQLHDEGMLAIDDYRQLTVNEAKARGVGFSNLTYLAYHLKATTDYISDTEARVHLTGKRRASINPVYPLIAILFDIGKSYPIDRTFSVTKEGARWKVCENLSALFQDA